MSRRKVRIVAISDTHGYEASLKPEDVPRGDLLVHCGDFSEEAFSLPQQLEGLQRFDAWLAAVTAARFDGEPPVVLCGNHDVDAAEGVLGRFSRRRGESSAPLFPKSCARFVDRTTTFEALGGALRCAAVPWTFEGSMRERHMQLEDGIDILLSHAPPYGIRDECFDGYRAGSWQLRSAVSALKRRPKAWLFGHIHEGFGEGLLSFPEGDVLCVNAAMANDGLAARLVRPPTVLEFEVGDPGIVGVVRRLRPAA